jgi:hypothetical protein
MDGFKHQPEDGQPSSPKAGEDELVVKAARFLKRARPKLNRFIVFARPRAEAAGQEALRYVREHEGELKQNAVKLARYRLHGPLGLVVDALIRDPAPADGPGTRCSQCGSVSVAGARFCTQCGSRLTTEEPPQR